MSSNELLYWAIFVFVWAELMMMLKEVESPALSPAMPISKSPYAKSFLR